MTPKFIELTRRIDGKAGPTIMVNPRRLNAFYEENGITIIHFGRGEYLCVMETVAQIKTKLNK